MQALWDGVADDTGHPLLVHFLAKLIDVADVPARDPVALTRAVQLYSARKIKFFRERPERFQSAVRTVAWGIGDCDDKARFVAACLRTFRIPVQLKFLHLTIPPAMLSANMARLYPTGYQVGHVYPIVWLPFNDVSKWVAAESVREYPLGYDPEDKARAKGFKVKTTTIGDDGEDLTHI
jgi:transglutaminase-like putative cysteine protease